MESLKSELLEMMNVFDQSNNELKTILDERVKQHNSNTIHLSSEQLVFDKRVNDILQQTKNSISKIVSDIHSKLDTHRREVNF